MAISAERKAAVLAKLKASPALKAQALALFGGGGGTRSATNIFRGAGGKTQAGFKKAEAQAIKEGGPGEGRTAKTFEQEQEERGKSRNLLAGLSQAEAEEFEIVPVGINPDGSVKRGVIPTTARAVRIKQEEQAGTQSVSQEKREVEQGVLEGEIEGLILAFGRARKEQGEIPVVGEFAGKPGFSRVTGAVASGLGAIGLSPATSVFNKKRKAFATIVAKAAGEVRPTDVDIERFLGTLMNPNLTDAENELIMLDLLTKVKEGGDEEAISIWRQATGKEIGESIPESAQLDLDETTRAEIDDIDRQIAAERKKLGAR